MKLKKISIAFAFVLLLFSFSTFAQNDRLTVEFVVFESTRDYTVYAGKSINYDSFNRVLASEESTGQSALIAKKSLDATLETENKIGTDNLLQLSDGKANYQSNYYENLFAITPFLIGGETNATSEIVSAQIFFETAKSDASVISQGLPAIDRVNFSSQINCRLNTFTIVGGGASGASNNGRQIYFGVYFARS